MKRRTKGKPGDVINVLPGHTESYSPVGVVMRAQHGNLVFTANNCGCANVSETDGLAYIGKWFSLCEEHRRPIVVTGLGAGLSHLDYEASLTRNLLATEAIMRETDPRPRRRKR